MPGERDVFDPLFAGVIDHRKGQSVFVRSTELINARALAAFRGFTARFLDGDRIAGDGVLTPDVALRINDVKRTVGLHRPDGAERVSPCAGQRGWP